MSVCVYVCVCGSDGVSCNCMRGTWLKLANIVGYKGTVLHSVILRKEFRSESDRRANFVHHIEHRCRDTM